MIEVKNAVKTFEGFRALDGADITVPDGGVYGLVGPNGAGKSTVIRHITGIYRPDSGEVLVGGACLREPRPKGPPRRHPRRLVLLPVRHRGGHDALLPGLLPRLRHRPV